jgi:hypothetical protein
MNMIEVGDSVMINGWGEKARVIGVNGNSIGLKVNHSDYTTTMPLDLLTLLEKQVCHWVHNGSRMSFNDCIHKGE